MGRSRRQSRSRGQALVEFALVSIVFFPLLFGFIDVARYVYTTTAYGQAAREGARYGSVEQWSFSCPGSVVTQTRENCTEAVTVSRIPAGAPIPIPPIAVSQNAPAGVFYSCPLTCRAGDLMLVQVRGQFSFLTPGLSGLLGTPTVNQSAQVVIQ